MAQNQWTEAELTLAFDLYCKTPFSRISSNAPSAIALANLVGRSPSAVAIKLANFARLDPDLKARNISGMKNGSAGEELIWHKYYGFWQELAHDCEVIIQNTEGAPTPDPSNFQSEDRFGTGKIRIGQATFRAMVLASYNFECGISGFNDPNLIIASHIIPWSHEPMHRLNPRNGICLNALLDRAFDKGIITFSETFEVLISSRVSSLSQAEQEYFASISGQKLTMPTRFAPEKEFVSFHRKNIFRQ